VWNFRSGLNLGESMARREGNHFVVTYKDARDGKVLALKVKSITDSSLGPAFVELSDFVFESSQLILDPAAEEFQDKFKNVRRLHLSIYHIISIEEIGLAHRGLKLKNDRSNIVVLKGEDPKK